MTVLQGSISSTGTTIKGSVAPAAGLSVKTVNLSAGRLIELSDVNPLDLNDGAVIVYNSTSEQFEIRRDMQNANTRIIGGTY